MSSARRRRILIASRIFAPETAAASFRLRALAASLAEGGAQVAVLTTTPPPGAAADPAIPRVRVRRWPVLRDASGYVRGYVQYLSFDVPLALRLLLVGRPDVVVVEPPPTTGLVVRVICGLRRIPYVYYAADIWSDAASSVAVSSLVVRVLRQVEAGVMSGAAAVVAVNGALAERVRQLAPRARVEVVGNGVDTAVFRAAEPGAGASAASSSSAHPSADTRPTAIYAGTTSEWQGADIFVRAMPAVLERVPDARLVFLGQGSAWEALRQTARELGLGDAVRFEGLVPPAQAAERIVAARTSVVSLMPGQGYDFALPTKVLASLACGTPVVFAGPGPVRELLASAPSTPGAGRAVDYEIHQVADALAEALASPWTRAERESLGAWAEENVSLDGVARRVRNVIGSVDRAAASRSRRPRAEAR